MSFAFYEINSDREDGDAGRDAEARGWRTCNGEEDDDKMTDDNGEHFLAPYAPLHKVPALVELEGGGDSGSNGKKEDANDDGDHWLRTLADFWHHMELLLMRCHLRTLDLTRMALKGN